MVGIRTKKTDTACVVSFSEEAGSLLALASDWLELDSPVEGIRFDSELVRHSWSVVGLFTT